MTGDEQSGTGDIRNRTSLGELQDMIEELMDALRQAKAVPLSTNVLVDREQLLSVLERLKSELPDELRAARWMVREREAFVARTNERAKEIIGHAEAESARLVSESHVLAEAVEEANALVKRSEGEARRIRLEAEDDADTHFERLEGLFTDVLERLRESRDTLRTARPADSPPPVQE